jgi:hypothetical protein
MRRFTEDRIRHEREQGADDEISTPRNASILSIAVLGTSTGRTLWDVRKRAGEKIRELRHLSTEDSDPNESKKEEQTMRAFYYVAIEVREHGFPGRVVMRVTSKHTSRTRAITAFHLARLQFHSLGIKRRTHARRTA